MCPACRAAHAGPAHFALAWRYEPLVRMEGLACRTVRFARSVEALPALHLTARLAAGAGGCTPGGCLLQAQLHNLASDTLQVTGLACPSRSWRLCQPDSISTAGGSGGGGSSSSSTENLQIASDMSAVLYRQLVPADGAPAAAQAGTGLLGSSLTDAEAGLLDASRHAAEAAAPKQLQPPAGQQQWQQQQQQPRRRQQQHEDEDEGSVDVVVLWQAASGQAGATPHRGFTCVHNQRCVHSC